MNKNLVFNHRLPRELSKAAAFIRALNGGACEVVYEL